MTKMILIKYSRWKQVPIFAGSDATVKVSN